VGAVIDPPVLPPLPPPIIAPKAQGMVSIATWNINSVRLRADQVVRFLSEQGPDVLCLQEIKCAEHLFPHEVFEAAGYTHRVVHGQKGYHGVATVSRIPLREFRRHDWQDNGEARHIGVELLGPGQGLLLENVYIPAGGDIPDREQNLKFGQKLDFLERMTRWADQLDRPTLIVNRGQLSLANRIKKRLVDILFSGLALLVLAPVLIIVAIAIRLDSPGPVFFRQLRVGYGNRPFEIFKFRSLRHEATDRDGNKSVSVGDSRVTRFGAFIRRTSIDELPQLLNVLLGDMSLVGPRPHALGSRAGEKLFWEIDPSYWQRHALKPGITGLAQIRGFRGETQAQEDLTQRLSSDIEYLEGWTLWRDFRIMIGTIRVLVHSKAF